MLACELTVGDEILTQSWTTVTPFGVEPSSCAPVLLRTTK
ncbi:hypothetical protein WP1_134 [Pseudomonas phage WP1]